MNTTRAKHSELPKRGVAAPFPISSGPFIKWERESESSLVICAISGRRAFVCFAGVSIAVSSIPQIHRFIDWVFGDGGTCAALFMSVGTAAMIYGFYWLVGKITPRTRFDRNLGIMIREPVNMRGADTRVRFDRGRLKLEGSRLKMEPVQMKFSEIGAIQICYGGREEGDSETAPYDWWQLVVVDGKRPPTRVVIAQSAQLEQLREMAKWHTKFLISFLWTW